MNLIVQKVADLKSNLQPATPVSDSGGVSARIGFSYQDHVGASFILKMISSPYISQVECETSDDIVVVRRKFIEYVQVKTTDAEKKWSQTELLKRGTGKLALKPSSLVEKSLLCDKGVGEPRFRIVSTRGVNKGLLPLTTDIDQRHDPNGINRLAKNFKKTWKETLSPGGRDLDYWVRNVVWQTVGDSNALAARNKQALSKLAEEAGANPTHSHLEEIYRDLLRLVREAAEASKISSPNEKVIVRQAILEWWKGHLEATTAATQKTAKPYRVSTEAFFAELHSISEVEILRALTGYDARYESGKWRAKQLAEYLADWLPEVALKASELVSVHGANLREKLRTAVKRIDQHRDIDADRLLAEMLLHVILRHEFKSEPIACKLFYQSGNKLKTFGNAHIIHDETDELWLGRAAVSLAGSYEAVQASFVSELSVMLDPDFLKEEREVILTLREPQHLQLTTLENALKRLSPIDDLLKVICIAVLIAYDSEVLSGGFSEDYKAGLIEEVCHRYENLKPLLPPALSQLKVHIFLIPIESSIALIDYFKAEIRG